MTREAVLDIFTPYSHPPSPLSDQEVLEVHPFLLALVNPQDPRQTHPQVQMKLLVSLFQSTY